MSKVEGLTIGEISQQLGKGKAQVSLSLHRALQRLHKSSEAQR
jgi:DNA-directed RNA polymerase specialized sigma24 family protein